MDIDAEMQEESAEEGSISFEVAKPGDWGIEKMRRLVKDCMQRNQTEMAQYYCEKLVAACPEEEKDLKTLLEIYLGRNQHRRALHLLEKLGERLEGARPKDYFGLEFTYLAARCMAAAKEWEDCIAMLEESLPEEEDNVHNLARTVSSQSEGINLVALMCLLLGTCYEMTDKREAAASWYRRSLSCDIYCSEAFFRLVDHHLISEEAQLKVLDNLDFRSEDDWLRDLYYSHTFKFVADGVGAERFARLNDHHGLGASNDVLASRAEYLYYRHDVHQAYEISKRVREDDPYHQRIIPVHIAALVDLGKKQELFYVAHKLIEAYPEDALSWFAVGCYYYCIKKFDVAQRYFSKATSADSTLAPAWIGFGNAFAAQDESDQAMAAYRTANRLFPGSHIPSLSIGMEYLRTNNLSLAERFLSQAAKVCSSDPLVYNELGVLHYKQGNYDAAIATLEKAMSLREGTSQSSKEVWEPTAVNLGHAYRKIRKLDEALRYYELALLYCPSKGSTHAAIGFTLQLQGKVDLAIESYHNALAIKPEDTFASEMLSRALSARYTEFGLKDLTNIMGESPFGGDTQMSTEEKLNRTLSLGSDSGIEESRGSDNNMSLSMSSSFLSANDDSMTL